MYKDVEVGVLAHQIRWVSSVGFGRPVRSNAEVDQLKEICQRLVSDPSLSVVPLFEEVLKPSVERLGNGELGELARIEFGLYPRTQKVRLLKGRRQFAKDHFEIGDSALARLERAMHRALAEDLLGRLEEVEVSAVGVDRSS